MEEKRVRLSAELEGMQVEYLRFDRLRMQQVFLNILSNAAKYCDGGAAVTLTVGTQALRDGKAALDVSFKDTGWGMSPEFLQRAFEPFACEMQKPELTYQSVGLGLAIVKNLIEQMGGTIEVESTLGKGSEFKLHLVCDGASAQDFNRKEACGAYDENVLRGRRVLLAEDQPINAEIARKMLMKKAWTWRWPKTGALRWNDLPNRSRAPTTSC